MNRPAAFLHVALLALVALSWASVPGSGQSVTVVVPVSGAASDAWQKLEDGRIRDADRAFAKALVAAPDDTTLLLGAAMAARRLGHGPAARRMLAHALQVDPALTSASLVLGSLLWDTGDLEGALRVYEAALVRAPAQAEIEARAAACRQELARLTRWPGDGGSHARVFFDGPTDEAAGRLAVATIERAYEGVGAVLQAWPPDPVTVILATGAASLPVSAGAPEWSTSLYDGRIRMLVRPPVKDSREFARVLTHEYAHAVLRGVAPVGVPAWINEGVAALLEPGGASRAERDLAAAGGARIPLARLQASFASLPPAMVTLAYAQSALVVQAIVDRAGMGAVLGLMADLAAGDQFAVAFQSRIGMPFAAFEREWTASRRERRQDHDAPMAIERREPQHAVTHGMGPARSAGPPQRGHQVQCPRGDRGDRGSPAREVERV